MGEVRAQVVFQGRSGLPEDRFVNVLHFSNGVAYDDHALAVRSALQALWVTTPDNPAAPQMAPGRFLSPYVERAFQVRTYDLTLPERERAPTILTGTLGEPLTAIGLPEEVAVCVTFQGVPPVTQRRRGRNYIGPLCTAVLSSTIPAGSPTRVDLTVQQVLSEAYADLGNNLSLGWVIRSEGARVPRANTSAPLGAILPVTNTVPALVWVDDAFDTQRRRGAAPVTRVSTLVDAD